MANSVRVRFASLRTSVENGAMRCGAALEHHTLWCVLLLSLSVLLPALLKAEHTMLTCDEIYTLRIAEQPTLRQLIDTSRRVDLHPPLHYLAERIALRIPGPVWFSARLPSLLATLGTFLLCFSLVRSVSGTLGGLIAAAVLWFTPALPFAWLNRPYALWLFFLTLLAFCYVRARRPGASAWWTAAVFVACSGMVLDYMAGLLCVLPFVMAEFWPASPDEAVYTTHSHRSLLLAALLLPCVSGLLYARQLRDFATNTFSPQYMDWVGTTLQIYGSVLLVPVGVPLLCCVLAWLLAGKVNRSEAKLPLHREGRSLLIAGTGLLLLPVLLALLAALRHTQFFPRYGACSSVGVACLTGVLAPRVCGHLRTASALLVLALLCATANLCQDAFFNPIGPWRAYSVQGVPPVHLADLNRSQPIVMARAVDYIEANEREPESQLKRTYYVYDREAAQQFSGSTVFETISTTADLLHFQTKVAPLSSFLSDHHTFYMVANYTHQEEWLPRWLVAHGAKLNYLGKFESTYEDDDVYQVEWH